MSQNVRELRKTCQDNVNQLGQTYRPMFDQIEKKLRKDVHAGEALENALVDFSEMLLEAQAAGLTVAEVFPGGMDAFYEELIQALPVITDKERRKRKKWFCGGVVAAIAAVFLLVWGAGQMSLRSDHYVEGQDHAYMYRSLIGGMTMSYAKGEHDYFFMRGKYLYRFDPETKEVSPLCTREDCLHSRQPDAIQYDICNANVVGDDFDKMNVAYWDGYVYYINRHDKGYYTLNRVKEDGSEGETIKKWTHCAMDGWRWIIHRGYLYFIRSEDVAEETGGSGEEIYIKRLSLNDPEKEEILYRVEDDGPALFHLQTVTAYGNQVYFLILGESREDSRTWAGLFRYDIRQKKMEEIALPAEYDAYVISQITFLQDQLVIMAATYKGETQTNDYCFLSDLTGDNMRVLPIQEFGYIHSDGTYLYRMETQAETSRVIVHVYDAKGTEIDSMSVDLSLIAGGSLSDYANISLGDEDGMFWIVSSDERKMWDLYWIDKREIGSWQGTHLELKPVDELRYGYAYTRYLTERQENYE